MTFCIEVVDLLTAAVAPSSFEVTEFNAPSLLERVGVRLFLYAFLSE